MSDWFISLFEFVLLARCINLKSYLRTVNIKPLSEIHLVGLIHCYSFQNVEHLKCTMSSVISVCLSGQICVWDIATGYRLKEINRNRSVSLYVYDYFE